MQSIKTTIFIMFTLLVCQKLLATDRHVYPGDTIQSIINICNPGDKIIIHGGTYNQSLSINTKIDITITNAGDGEVILNGDGTSTHTIFIQNSSSITIANLTIKNIRKQEWSTGITVMGTGSNLTITGNKITDISYVNKSWDPLDNPGNTGIGANGIAIIGDNAGTPMSQVSVTNNEISYCITGWSEAMALKGNIVNFNIQNNKVHHITNIGIDVLGLATYPALSTNNQPNNGIINGNEVYNTICNYTDNGAIYVDGAMNVLVSNNKIHNNKFGITVGCENQVNKPNATSSGIHVRNNLIYNNSLAGILYGSNGVNNGSAEGLVTYSTITGNTLIKNASSNQWGSEIVIQNANNIDCYNNILYGRYMQLLTIASGVSALNFRANCYYNTTSSFSASIQNSTGAWSSMDLPTFKTFTNDSGTDQSFLSNPNIVNADANNPDPHLSINSPCINSGKTGFTPFSGEVDYDGQSRVNGSGVDIGVDETGTINACPSITIDGSLTDWTNIVNIAAASNQTCLSLKMTNNSQALYFGVSGAGMDNSQYQIFINSDNNQGTGYQDNQFTVSGADYLIENGILYKYNETGGWSWTAVDATINIQKNTGVTELSINRAAFASLNSTITVAFKDMSNWVTQSTLPPGGSGYSGYSLINCQ